MFVLPPAPVPTALVKIPLLEPSTSTDAAGPARPWMVIVPPEPDGITVTGGAGTGPGGPGAEVNPSVLPLLSLTSACELNIFGKNIEWSALARNFWFPCSGKLHR